jgi:hypothetical protein
MPPRLNASLLLHDRRFERSGTTPGHWSQTELATVAFAALEPSLVIERWLNGSGEPSFRMRGQRLGRREGRVNSNRRGT